MTLTAATTAYFNAWIARDADAILATLAEGGTYETRQGGRQPAFPALKAPTLETPT
jgi:hypothetical protein